MANYSGRSAPFPKPKTSGSSSAPIRAGCKGDGALGVTSKCPLDRWGGGGGRESAVVPTFLAQQNNCCSPFSTNPATVPKSSASSAPVLKKTPPTNLQNDGF